MSRRLVVIGSSMMVVVVLAVAAMTWHSRLDVLNAAGQNLGKLGIAISEQTSRSMQAGDLVLEDLRKQISILHPRTVEEFKAMLANKELFRFLKDRAEFLPQVDAFTIIAADGKLVNYSRQWPVVSIDLSDRDYFAYFRDHDVAGAFVSAPVQNRASGGWTAYLVRRVNGPYGEFLGMVLAAIDLQYFQDFFKALTVGAGTTVTLLRDDGIVLTSFPATEVIGSVLPGASSWDRIVKVGPGMLRTEGVGVAGTEIVSVNPLADYPLVIDVSVAEWDALGSWLRTAIVAGLCTVLAVVCVAVLLRALEMQFRRLEASEALLANRNARLQVTQQRLQAQAVELSAGRARLAEQSTTLQAALAHMNQGIIMVAADGTVAVCNERAMDMLDLSPTLLSARPSFGSLVAHQRSMGEFTRDPDSPCTFGFEAAIAGPRSYERERPNGCLLEVETVPIEGGGMVRTFADITDRRRSEMQVQHLAHHDGLTSLVNRTVFQQRLLELILDTRGGEEGVAVFYLDLDGFKLVNDTHGHGVGDAVLVTVAKRLQAAVRATDVVARMGGDEFAVIQPVVHSASDAVELATRLLASVSGEYDLGGVRCSIGLSIGIALYPGHATTTTELLRKADVALYRAKVEGKRTFRMFDPAQDGGRDRG